uniref:Uncharacterized protein n=1 Tax=Plectus sambesii TaxID=2011161 RepID=A0A914XEC9_9BILA
MLPDLLDLEYNLQEWEDWMTNTMQEIFIAHLASVNCWQGGVNDEVWKRWLQWLAISYGTLGIATSAISVNALDAMRTTTSDTVATTARATLTLTTT